MILIDRIFRFLSKDINLPIRCYASKQQLYSPKCNCDCKIFCKKLPGGTPAYQTVRLPSSSSKKYYYRIINEQKYQQQ